MHSLANVEALHPAYTIFEFLVRVAFETLRDSFEFRQMFVGSKGSHITMDVTGIVQRVLNFIQTILHEGELIDHWCEELLELWVQFLPLHLFEEAFVWVAVLLEFGQYIRQCEIVEIIIFPVRWVAESYQISNEISLIDGIECVFKIDIVQCAISICFVESDHIEEL